MEYSVASSLTNARMLEYIQRTSEINSPHAAEFHRPWPFLRSSRTSSSSAAASRSAPHSGPRNELLPDWKYLLFKSKFGYSPFYSLEMLIFKYFTNNSRKKLISQNNNFPHMTILYLRKVDFQRFIYKI